MRTTRSWKPLPPCGWLLILATSFFAVSTRAQDVPIGVSSAGPPHVEINPGQIATTIFRVTNRTDSPLRVVPEVEIPKSWRFIVGPSPFALDRYAINTRLLSISIPPTAPAGDYSIVYRAQAEGSTARVADSLIVSVLPLTAVEIRLLSAPRFVVAGKPYTMEYVVSNAGNAPSTVRLSASTNERFEATVDSSAIALSPAASRRITVRVQTPAEVSAKVLNEVRITARSDREPERTVTASAAVDVVSQSTQARVPWRQVPVMARFRTAGEGGDFGAQAEIDANFAPFEDRAGEVDLLIRGPNLHQLSRFGLRDVYRLNYQDNAVAVWLGDNTYELSPLTERGIFGFGAGAAMTGSPIQLGGYVQQRRYSTIFPERQAAAYLRSHHVPNATFSLNYLYKDGAAQEGPVGSIQADFIPWPNVLARLEVASSGTDLEDDGAASVEFRGRHEAGSYGVRLIHAGRRFNGEFRSQDVGVINAGVRLTRRLRAVGSLSSYFRYPTIRGVGIPTQRNTNMRTGLEYGDLLAGTYSRQTRDFLSGAQAVENAAELRVTPVFGPINLLGQVEGGTVHDALSGTSLPFARATASATLVFGMSGAIEGYTRYVSGGNLYTLDNEERLSTNLYARMLVGDRTRINLGMSNDQVLAPSERRSSNLLLDLAGSYTFGFGHRITARARRTAYTFVEQRHHDYVFSLEYELPLQVPVARKRDVGGLTGMVYDRRTGRGLSNVLLYLGDSAVLTDASGRYAFPGVQPDDHFVYVDAATLPQGHVTDVPQPYRATVTAGKVRERDIAVVPSGAVTGRLIRYEFMEARPTEGPDEDREMVERGGTPGMIVQLATDQERHQQATGPDGRFRFTRLRPGRWTLIVPDGQLPENTTLEAESYQIDLKPGSSEDVTLRVLPRRRTIRFLNEGPVEVVLESDAEGKEADEVVPKSDADAEGAADVYAGTPSTSADDSDGVSRYLVTPSDISLMDISRKVYDDPGLWPKIWLANRRVIPNPDVIEPGRWLQIPPKSALSERELRARRQYYDQSSLGASTETW